MIILLRKKLHSVVTSSILVFLSFSLLYQPILHGGLVKASLWLYGTKHVYLFGDHHKASTPEENNRQVDGFIEALEETASLRNEPLHIFWEKSSQYVKAIHQLQARMAGRQVHKDMVIKLDDELEKRGIPDVTIEDTEIRTIGISANNIFASACFDSDWDYQAFKGAPFLKDLTFQHIIDSFNQWLTVVQEFKKQNAATVRNFINFDFTVETAVEEYEHFLETLAKHSVPPSTNVAKFSMQSFANRDWVFEKLQKHNFEMFCPLYDAYLFKIIHEYQGNHVALVAGAMHASFIENMLLNQNGVEKMRYLANQNTDSFRDIKLLSKRQLVNALKGYSYFTLLQSSLVSVAVQFIRIFHTMHILITRQDPEHTKNS